MLIGIESVLAPLEDGRVAVPVLGSDGCTSVASASSSTITKYCIAPSFVGETESFLALWSAAGVMGD